MIDYFIVLILVLVGKKKVYYEANEVRKHTAFLDSENSSFASSFKRKLTFYKYSMSERLTKYFTGLFCISTNIQTYFEKWNSNTLRIPILSNNNGLSYRKKGYSGKEPFRICLAGSISIAKENMLEFVDAVSEVVNAKYEIEINLYGPVSGNDLEILKEYAYSKNHKNLINYRGLINHRDLNKVLQEQHLLVLPRGNNLQNYYGFSTKLSEYLITGVPCLITDVSDNALYVKDGVNGFVVPPNDVVAMANKIRYIILNYSSLASTIGENALDTVNKELSYRVHSEKISSFLFDSN
jgi:glycosyltransferase involved in cell wall biosynthesis